MTPYSNDETGWTLHRLDEVCEVNPARDYGALGDDSEISLVPMAAIEEGTGRLDASEHVTLGSVRKKSLTHFREGDVVVAKISPSFENGKVALASGLRNGYAAGTTELNVFRPCPALDRRYLLYFLLSYDVRMPLTRTFAGTVGQQRIALDQLKSVRLPIPPLPEQQAIVEAIERTMTLLRAVTRATASTTTKSGLLRHALAHAAVTGRLIGLSPRQQGVWPTPPDWDWQPVADVAEVRGGIQKKPDRRPLQNKYPFLRVANVQRNQLDLENIHEVELFGGELDRYRLESGDLLVVEGNGSIDHIGRSAIWDGSIENCVHQNHLIRVRPGPPISPQWLNLVWNSPACTEQIQGVAQTTSGLFTLSTKKVASVQIPVPPRDVQDQIVRTVEARRGIADHLEGSMLPAVEARTNALRRSILKAAFEGRLTGDRSLSDGVLDEAIA